MAKIRTSLMLRPETAELLKQAAEQERRSASSMADVTLLEVLQDKYPVLYEQVMEAAA